jgi:hypothetical protein
MSNDPQVDPTTLRVLRRLQQQREDDVPRPAAAPAGPPPEPSVEMVRAAFAVMYPNTAWNPYQDMTTHDRIRDMLRAALRAARPSGDRQPSAEEER